MHSLVSMYLYSFFFIIFLYKNEIFFLLFIPYHRWACCARPRREVAMHGGDELRPSMVYPWLTDADSLDPSPWQSSVEGCTSDEDHRRQFQRLLWGLEKFVKFKKEILNFSKQKTHFLWAHWHDQVYQQRLQLEQQLPPARSKPKIASVDDTDANQRLLCKPKGRSCERRRQACDRLRGPSSNSEQTLNDRWDIAARRRLRHGDLVERLFLCEDWKIFLRKIKFFNFQNWNFKIKIKKLFFKFTTEFKKYYDNK